MVSLFLELNSGPVVRPAEENRGDLGETGKRWNL